MSMQQDGQSVTEIASLKMISETDPGKAIALVILLFLILLVFHLCLVFR